MKAFVSEKSEFVKRLLWLSNFTVTAILNNCDVSWLRCSSDTKSGCSGTIGQPLHVTIIQDGGAGKFENQNKRFEIRFFPDTNPFIGKSWNNFNCKHYDL